MAGHFNRTLVAGDFELWRFLAEGYCEDGGCSGSRSGCSVQWLRASEAPWLRVVGQVQGRLDDYAGRMGDNTHRSCVQQALPQLALRAVQA